MFFVLSSCHEGFSLSLSKPFVRLLYFPASEEVCIVGKEAAIVSDQSILAFFLTEI